jgi:hypothetical protein
MQSPHTSSNRMKFYNQFIFLLLFSSPVFSQSHHLPKVSRPEKFWALTHPFIAKKAIRITKEVQVDVDSIKKTGEVGTDNNGGSLDAVKHAYWMTALTIEIGKRKALKLGKAHEKGNYLQYKKNIMEDVSLPDSVSSAMDLKNNEAGAEIGAEIRRTKRNFEDNIMSNDVDYLKEGKLFVIKKDKLGNFLYCDDTFINMNDWAGRWGIPKCLIASNQEPP